MTHIHDDFWTATADTIDEVVGALADDWTSIVLRYAKENAQSTTAEHEEDMRDWFNDNSRWICKLLVCELQKRERS